MSLARTGVSVFKRLGAVPRQLAGINPFGGNYRPTRVPLFRPGRPTLPFPHPWNFRQPIKILESYFWGAEEEKGPGRHNRYFEFPGFRPVFVTRDPTVIRAILTATGEQEGEFDRDTLPSTGIARATGADTLLFSNGTLWRRQRKIAAPPFGKTSLFNTDVFASFEQTAREAVRNRLLLLRHYLRQHNARSIRLAVEPEVKALMLELLVKCFFGAQVDYDDIRHRYVPALERCIGHIVLDTVVNRVGLPHRALARFSSRYAQAVQDAAVFDELTSIVLEARRSGRGLWPKLKQDIPDQAMRSNIRVFLAGALEATTSFASWAISHLSRHPEWQEKVYQEVRDIKAYTPECLSAARDLVAALEETLRLTPALYFLPRTATVRTRVELENGNELTMPAGTHILLDVWHANRHEDHWGTQVTGSPALAFAPERWRNVGRYGVNANDRLHFGFGYGPRVCPGKHLGTIEVALAVGVFVKLFRFRAVHAEYQVSAGVSTKPADGALVELELRPTSAGMTSEEEWERLLAQPPGQRGIVAQAERGSRG